MDQERERIQADLRGLLEGEVRCDDVFLQMYASDASIYEIRPLGVIRPRGVADVVASVQYAAENGIAIHARGAGTGVAGESLGPGLVLDFSYSMRRVIRTDEDTVRCQAGVVHAILNRHLAGVGKLFGPDPATRDVSTIGGVLGVNGAGSRLLRYGSARDRVQSLQLVLADGSVIEAGQHDIDGLDAGAAETGRRENLVRRLADLLQRHRDTINATRPRARAPASGYYLDALDSGRLDLARMLVGSEGTLALITEATLQTDPLPAASGIALLFFERLELAARGALEVAGMGISACDMMDRRLLSIARESDVRFDLLIPRDAEAMLLIEVQGSDMAEVRDVLQQIVVRLQRRKRLAFDARLALDDEDAQLFWQLAHRVVPSLYQLKGSTRPLPFIEDIAVPPGELPDFLVTIQNVMKNHQVTASLFSHAAHGQLHVRPFLDLADPASHQLMQRLAEDLFQEVVKIGGIISSEHGFGLSRSWFSHRHFGARYEIMRQIKRIFDPENLLNPGKLVGENRPPMTDHLRRVAVPMVPPPPDAGDATEGQQSGNVAAAVGLIQLQLAWPDATAAYTARTCNGCGRCRTQLPDERMCPIFRYAPREEASPRAKANLMRAVITGRLDPNVLTGEELKDVADLCVNCHQCRLECPAGVDIPKLMVECKAQYVSSNGLRGSDWLLGRLDRLSRWASLMTPLANWSIGNRQMRWVLEKLTGIAQGRKLPRLAKRSFLSQAHRRRLTRPSRHAGRKVVYFVDVYANWYDVQLASSLVDCLQHNGVSVYVPPQQLQSGMALVSMGAVEQARRIAARNVSWLAEAVRQGYDVVATEPAAALCLTHEYRHLLDDDDTRLVAEHTSEACSYLWKMHQSGELKLDLKPINAALGYHQPCHLRAMQAGTPGLHLLRLIPGLHLRSIEQGCSGMAGTYGLKRQNYRSSLRAGWGLISALRSPAIQLGTTECSACKMQMEQGTSKPTIHPLKLLALAYGLQPEVAKLLTARNEELIVS